MSILSQEAWLESSRSRLLSWRLRSDNALRSRIASLCASVDAADTNKRLTEAERTKQRETLLRELLQACDYNVALLLPYYFPKSAENGQPLSSRSRNYLLDTMQLRPHVDTITAAGRQIGKSTRSIALSRILCDLLQGLWCLYVVPYPSQLKTYVERCRLMLKDCRFQVKDQELKQNLTFREFPNQSVMQMVHVLRDAREARSKTADVIEFDEYQLMDPDLEDEIVQVQRSRALAARFYSGTATTIDSPLELAYEDSSQGRWQIYCECGVWHDTGDPDVCFAISANPTGPTCTKCGRLLDVSEGLTVHAYPDRLNKAIGLRVPQIIVPEWTIPSRWPAIYKDLTKYPRDKAQQEIFGIPCLTAAKELSLQDLMDCCLVDKRFSQFRDYARSSSSPYRIVVSGCDWGGSDYNDATKTKTSFTVHVILGFYNDGSCDLLFARRYSGTDYKNVAKDIIGNHLTYGAAYIASDAGVGAAYNMLLRDSNAIPLERHLIFNLTGPNTRALAEPSEGKGGIPNMLMLNKSESLSMTFLALRNRRIRWGVWEEVAEFAKDLLNITRVPAELPGGTTQWLYIRNPRKADDFAQALNFAYTYGRVLMGETVVEDSDLLERLRSGHIVGADPGIRIPFTPYGDVTSA